MTTHQVAEHWRDRFLVLARGADNRTEETVCLEAAAILERLREELERLCIKRD